MKYKMDGAPPKFERLRLTLSFEKSILTLNSTEEP